MRFFPNLLLILPLWACGDPPQPVDRPDPGGSTPPPTDVHATVAQGQVLLEGTLATRPDGYVFISIKPSGQIAPSYSRKYSFMDPEVDPPGEGRRLRFELSDIHRMDGFSDGDHVLEAWFDTDGFVDTKEGGVRADVPMVRGQTDLEVQLRLDEDA